ncbi:MAG: DUF3017 domain-containing protein [Bifidobacterium boum]|nr:DUF3017 domain-containing protein [Bifidobacterium boum]MCI5861032.1 DUF3017 domain-containing protein [Bifidobacterium boum]
MAHEHPYVSEAREGKPGCEWTVALLVCLTGILAGLGYTTAATIVLVVTAVVLGLIRVILRDRSPWKVRSVVFDSLMCLCFGLGLSVLALSIHFMV